MHARVRSISTLDEADQTPVNPSLAWVGVDVAVGPADGPGEEYFHVDVVTPGALEEELSDGGFLQGRHLLITHQFDWQSVTGYLREQFEQPEAASWPELATILGRIGQGESEDYQPYVPEGEAKLVDRLRAIGQVGALLRHRSRIRER